jgi:putative membrane protein
MSFIIEVLVLAASLFALSTIIKDIVVKDYGTAIWVCLVIGFLNATIGAVIRFPLNLLSLFLITFIVRIIVSVLMIKLANRFIKGFRVKTWLSALILAIAMAAVGAVID